MSQTFSSLVHKLDDREPPVGDLRRAAVSVILKDKEEPSVLLIKRAEHADDPWSGQVAFPGGKTQDGDASLKDTAMRETREEVGVDLRGAEFLGYFKSFTTHTGTMTVVPSAFLLTDEPRISVNEEVASYRWAKLALLASENAKSTYRLEFGGQQREMPAILVEDYVVWGLTHRIISTLLE